MRHHTIKPVGVDSSKSDAHASNKHQRKEEAQTFSGVGHGNILCHVAERRLLRVP